MPLEPSPREPGPLLTQLALLFNESVMGLLALIALATALGPMVFDASPDVERTLSLVEWVLVGIFAVEFVIQGVVAHDRRAWIRSPWRIVDAVTVLGPFAALLPQVSDVASGSLMLRMLRVGRALAFGTRAGSVAVRQRRDPNRAGRTTIPTVRVVDAAGGLAPVGAEWGSILAWTRQPAACWFHASNVNRDRFHELARAAGVADPEIARVLDADAHARLRQVGEHARLVLQIPRTAESGFPEVHRDRIFAVVTKEGMFTATTGSLDLHSEVEQISRDSTLPDLPFSARIVCALLLLARSRNLIVAGRFDEEARRLEALEGGSAFLRDTFRLRREMSTTALDLWHVKGIVKGLADGKTTLGGIDLRDETYLDNLLAEMDSLYETVNRSKEEIVTLIELHINVKSFEMNGFLKLLAIVSFLGLIPSVAGGLLGMNVAGNPWPVTLGQVAFGVAMGMAVALYVFAVKGWLK